MIVIHLWQIFIDSFFTEQVKNIALTFCWVSWKFKYYSLIYWHRSWKMNFFRARYLVLEFWWGIFWKSELYFLEVEFYKLYKKEQVCILYCFIYFKDALYIKIYFKKSDCHSNALAFLWEQFGNQRVKLCILIHKLI